MTNYYAYRNWLVKINAPLLGRTKISIFNLNSSEMHHFFANDNDTHTFVCQYIDFNYKDSTNYYIGFPALMYISGQEKQMAKEIFGRSVF